MKDALGHGSDGDGGGPRGLRSGINMPVGASFSAKALNPNQTPTSGQDVVNNFRAAQALGGHAKSGPVAPNPAMFNAHGHTYGSPEALADFRQSYGGPRNHTAEAEQFRGGQREIARLRRAGK